MSLSDWIITISTGFISLLIGIISYFAHKWISGVDETLQKHGKKTETLEKAISTLKTEIQTQRMEIPIGVRRAFEDYDRTATLRITTRLDELSTKTQKIEYALRENILPKVEKVEELSGKVIVLEETVQRFVAGLQKIQKKP